MGVRSSDAVACGCFSPVAESRSSPVEDKYLSVENKSSMENKSPPVETETSLAYSISLMESYFSARKLGDNKFHKILFVAGPIIGFLLAFVCFYTIFLGVTEQSNRIFEKKDEEIKLWQKQSEHYRNIHEGIRESLLHEKYEDSRILDEELQKCRQSQAETIDEVLGLKNVLRDSKLKSQDRLNDVALTYSQRIREKNEIIQKLVKELKDNRNKIDQKATLKQIGNVLLMLCGLAAIVLFAIFRPSKDFYFK